MSTALHAASSCRMPRRERAARRVDPIFTWVRLAQRVLASVHIDKVPPDVRLVIGMIMTIEVQPNPNSASDVNLPADRNASLSSANLPTVPR